MQWIGGKAVTFMFNISSNATKQMLELLLCLCVCVCSLPYHIGRPAGRNLSPPTLALFLVISLLFSLVQKRTMRSSESVSDIKTTVLTTV